MIRILNTGGRAVAERVMTAYPDAEVVRIKRDEPVDGDLAGDVLLASVGSKDLIAPLARRVTWVHVFGTGIDWLPPEVFEATVVTCSRGGSAIAISEFVLAAMLSFEKQLPELWDRPPAQVFGPAELGGLHGRHLGLVGLGGIATAVATRALAFGMSVRAVRRHPGASPVAGVEMATREDIFRQADHLVLAAPATSETHHLIGRDTTGQLKAGVHLVNIARGSLIDQ